MSDATPEKAVKVTKKAARKELVWRRPPGMKFDVTPTDRVDDATWQLLESLCPSRRVLLQYSTGKDSVMCWFELRERGFDVIPFFKETIPGLSFFDKPMASHEKYFGRDVHIVPAKKHLFALMKYFNDANDIAKFGVDLKDEILYQCVSKSAFKRFRSLMVDQLLAEYNCDVCVMGTKASDSLHRRTHFKVDGPYTSTERVFALLWRIKKSAPLALMIENRIPIPEYYLWLGRSPELYLEHEYFFIKKYYPDDYAKLCSMFKNLDVYVKKYEHMKETHHAVRPRRILVEAREKGYPFV